MSPAASAQRIRRRLFRFHLPLLAKELVEQAARRRTYVVRTAYAVLLFAIFLIRTSGYFSDPAQVAARLGHGRSMFDALFAIQFIGVLLFLPAMMSGVLTYEKERHSMALLILTDMKPREILAQKYLSRLIPAVNFILLSLPLLAFCYAYGGVTGDALLTGIVSLLMTCLQIGALALLCSSICTTSAGALVSTYLAIPLLYLGVPFLLSWAFDLSGSTGDIAFCHLPVLLYFSMPRHDTDLTIAASIVPLLVTALFLVLARVFLVRRAFATPRNLAVGFLKWLDRTFDSVNDALGGIRIGKPRDTSLPGDHPVAWREVTRKSLGRPVYLIRIVLVLSLPVVLVAVAGVSSDSAGGWSGVLSVWAIVFWTLAALAIAILSANAIASERANQTLEVLLTTPLEARGIVREKLRGVRRLILVLFIPFISLFALKAFWMDTIGMWLATARSWSSFGHPENDWPWWYLVFSSLATATFLPLVSWLSVFIALRARSRFRAIVVILLVLAVWNVLPLLLLGSYTPSWQQDFQVWLILHWLAPSTTISVLEAGVPHNAAEGTMAWLCASLLVYAVSAILLKRLCLSQADAYLGRARPWYPAWTSARPASPWQRGPRPERRAEPITPLQKKGDSKSNGRMV